MYYCRQELYKYVYMYKPLWYVYTTLRMGGSKVSETVAERITNFNTFYLNIIDTHCSEDVLTKSIN